MTTPDQNILVELDNVSRQQCELAQRQRELLYILKTNGEEAFCYALACLMELSITVKNYSEKPFKEQ